MKVRLLLAALLLAACSKPPKDGGLIADVHIDSAANVTCLELQIADKNGAPLVSKRFPRELKDQLVIGISQAGEPDLPTDVKVRAVGLWSASGCTEPARLNTAPSDQQGHFTAATVTRLDFTLRAPGAIDDADQDGYTGAASGGPDCDDTASTINPAASEACTLPADNNCNGRIGCDDPACAGKACVRPAVTLAFASTAQSVVATQCSQALVVESRDSMNLAVPVAQNTTVSLVELGALSLQFFSDSGCTLPATTLDLAKGSKELRFYARTATAGATRIEARANGFGPAQQDLRVVAGPAIAVAFKNPAQTVKSDACSSAVVIEARDLSNNAAPVATDVPLALAVTPPAGFALFSDASCSVALSMPKLSSGTESTAFYFKPSRAPGTVKVDVTTSLGMATQTETVVPGDPTRIVFVTASQRVTAGACSGAMTLKLQDAQLTDTTAPTALSLAVSGPSLRFFTSSTCALSSLVTDAPVPAGAGTTTVYFIATGAGAPVVTASGAGLTLATQVQTIDPAAPVKLGFTTAPQGVQTTQCSGPVKLSTLDAFDNPSSVTAALPIALSASPATGFTFYLGAGCGGAAITSTSIAANASSVTFSYRGTTAGMVTMTADSSLDPDPSQTTNIGVMLPSRLAYLTSPQSHLANECSSAVTLESRDTGDNRSNVMSDVTIALAAAPSTGFAFFSDAQCTTPVTSVTLAANTSQAAFYWLGTAAGTVAMNPTSSLTGPGMQTATVRPAAASALVFTTPPRSAVAGACSAALTVQTRDAFGNVAPVAADTALALTAATGLTFFADATCSGAALGTATLPGGQSTTTFYARGTVAPTYNVVAQHPTVGSATQALTITPAAAAKLVVLTAPQTLLTGQCSGALTVERRDAFDNPITAQAALTVTFTGGNGLAFFTGPTCMTGTGTAPIAMGSSTVTVYFRGTAPGMPQVTVLGAGSPVSQTEVINVAPPSTLAFTSAPQTAVTAGSVSAPVVVETRDGFGNPSPVSANTTLTLSALPATFVTCGDPGCVGVDPVVQVGAGLSSATFYFRGNIAQTFSIAVSATGFGAGPAQMETVVAAAVSQLRITAGGAQTRPAGTCSQPVTVQRQDLFGNAVTAGATAVTLSASPGTGFTFFQGGGCATPTPTVNISAAASTGTFNFLGTVPGTVQVTVSSGSLATDTQPETIGALSANHLAYVTAPQGLLATTPCSGAVTVESRDSLENVTPVAVATTLTPSTNGGSPTFFSDPGCTVPAPTLGMTAGSSSATYYLTATGTTGSPFTLTTSGTGLTAATQPLTVAPGPASRIAFVGSGQNIGVDACSAAATVRTLDAFNNVSPVTVATTVTPSAAPAGGVTFFTNAACSTGAGGALTLNPGESTGAFFMKGGPHAAGTTVSVSVATSPALTLVAPQTETLVAGVASRLALTSAPQTLMAGECSAGLTVQARDAANNNTAVSGATTVNLSAALSTGFSFYGAAGCAGPTVTSVAMTQGTGTSTFWVKGITGGTFDVTAAATGLSADTQSVVVQPAVRTGTCSLAVGATSVPCAVTPALRDLTRTLMVFEATTSDSNSADNNAVRCALTDTSTLTCGRGGATGSAEIRWYTLSRPTGLTVQHLPAVASTATPSQAVGITPVVLPLTSTFVLMSTQTAGVGTAYDAAKLTSARLTAADTVTLQRLANPTVSLTHALQVVQWSGATVVHGSATIANGALTGAATGLADTAANPTLLLYSWRWAGGAGTSSEMCHLGVRGAFTSTTSLAFSRGAGNGANACNDNDLAIEYERVTLPAAANRVEAFGIDTSAATVNQAVTAVDATRALPFFSGQGFGGGQSWGETEDVTADRVRDVTARASFTDATTVRIDRGAGSNTRGLWTLLVWQVTP
ncbi:MAG: hypothetical protein IPJ65_12295 [Archangiaceae bacterium]|nr:hypothetical protein [Archangiaceae bacterium]